MGIGGQLITRCSICGGTAGSTAGHSSRECVTNLRSRLDDAEAVLKSVKCPRCEGNGNIYTGQFPSLTSKRAMDKMKSCPDCKGSGLHPDAAEYFRRWK
jgi:hypothetical protein